MSGAHVTDVCVGPTGQCSGRLSGNIVLTPNRQGVIYPINKNAAIAIFSVFFDEL